MTRLHRFTTLLALAVLLVACDGNGRGSEATPTSTVLPSPTQAPTATAPAPTPTVAIPNTAPATEIELPDGFAAYAVADGFYRPTSFSLSPDGAVYVSQRHGSVFRLQDNDGDGIFEQRSSFAGGFGDITGIVLAPQGALYVSSTGRVTSVRDTDGDTVSDTAQDIIPNLPNGLHQNNGLVFGPDGKLYLTNGSTCDECEEADERSGTILRANPDGSDLHVYARGMRNPYDLVFDSGGRLWATDNGSDAPCATIDELNLIEETGDYGWPYGAGCDPYQSGTPPAANLGLHTASTGIDQYKGEHFPAGYSGNLFVTLWGSFVYEPQLPQGANLLRVAIAEGPEAPQATVLPFATGFQHPIDVVMDRDGTLLVLDYGEGSEDDTSGRLYRIVYTGG